MKDFPQYFNFELAKINYQHFYIYFAVAALIAFYLIYKSDSKYKFEFYFISFYLLTGNTNQILTFKIPGVTFFEIQPIRFIYLLLLLFVFRKMIFAKERLRPTLKIPWFEVFLFAYVILLTISVLLNSFPEGLKTIIDAIAFLIIIVALRLMADKPSYDVIGKSIIIGAIASSIISVLQLVVNPYFLRIGDNRMAFGDFMRSNGIFSTEYFNSYYLIIAISWVLVTVKSTISKVILVGLFTLGVLCSFQRMSWIILALVIVIYFFAIKKIALEKMLLTGLVSFAVLLSISIFYYQDIVNSTLVKERLTDSVDGRKGYYSMVLENIGKKPLFGYGDLQNEVYYVNLLRITRDRDRATATTGDLHSGYFSSLFLYGVPASVCFLLFVLLSVNYYAKLFVRSLYYIIPFFVSIIYMIGNLTNTFLFLKYIAVLYAIHMGIGMGLKKIKDQTQHQNQTEGQGNLFQTTS